MKVGLALATPLLLASLISGLLISLLQAATQINEMTLSFIPKILAVFATLVVAGPGCSACCWTICAPYSAVCLP